MNQADILWISCSKSSQQIWAVISILQKRTLTSEVTRPRSHISSRATMQAQLCLSLSPCFCSIVNYILFVWVTYFPFYWTNVSFPGDFHSYWNGLPFPSPGHLPHPGTESPSLHWQEDSLPLSHLRSPKFTTKLKLSVIIMKPHNYNYESFSLSSFSWKLTFPSIDLWRQQRYTPDSIMTKDPQKQLPSGRRYVFQC